MESFERETWAQVGEVGKDSTSAHQPVNTQGKCFSLHTSTFLHGGAQGAAKGLQKGLGKHPGMHLEHTQHLERSRGCYQRAEKCLPQELPLTCRAGQPGGPCQWHCHLEAELNCSAFFQIAPQRLSNVIFITSHIQEPFTSQLVPPASGP